MSKTNANSIFQRSFVHTDRDTPTNRLVPSRRVLVRRATRKHHAFWGEFGQFNAVPDGAAFFSMREPSFYGIGPT